jgi:hypothetical protein
MIHEITGRRGGRGGGRTIDNLLMSRRYREPYKVWTLKRFTRGESTQNTVETWILSEGAE